MTVAVVVVVQAVLLTAILGVWRELRRARRALEEARAGQKEAVRALRESRTPEGPG